MEKGELTILLKIKGEREEGRKIYFFNNTQKQIIINKNNQQTHN